jgi:phospholipid transport system substrate-binding protein
MRHLRYNLMIILTLGLLAGTNIQAVQAADEPAAAVHQERTNFAKSFAQTVLTILHDPKTPYGNRRNILRQSFSNSVDTDWIAKFVLGRAWRDATDEQREQYTYLYRRFLTETYVTRFAESASNSIYTIKILGIDDDENNEFTVRTHMRLMNNEELQVNYLVSDKDGHYKVRDFIIDNVSLITTHRAEFTKLAAEEGIDGAIRTLQERLGRGREMSQLTQ